MSRLNPIVTGIILAILGVVFIMAPWLSGSMISVFMGAGLMVSGLSSLIAWLQLRKAMPCWSILAFALAAILLAAVCLIHPLAMASTIEWIIAGCIVICGIFRIFSTITTPFLSSTLKVLGLLSGALDILLGGLALAMPEMIMYFLGAGIVLVGATTILMGIVAKKAQPIDVDPL